MRTTVTIPDDLFQQLMQFTKTQSRTEAVQVAVESYVRRARLEQLRALRGKIDILSNEEIEAAELQELEGERG